MIENEALYYQSQFTSDLTQRDSLSEFFLNEGASSVTETHVSETSVSLTIIHLNKDLVSSVIPASVVTLLDTELEYKWIEYYQGFYCADHIYIHPSHLDFPTTLEKDDIIIIINPKDAFGDGRHPTTTLCAQLLRKHIKKHRVHSLCDIGSGTGILSILAEKLGVPEIDAFDIESDAVQNACGNIILNECTHINCFQDSIETFTPTRTYDVVMANLLSILIEQNIETLIQCLDQNGILFVSGIGVQWKKDIEIVFLENNLCILESLEFDNWLAYSLSVIQ